MQADVVGQRQPRYGELDEVTELKGWGAQPTSSGPTRRAQHQALGERFAAGGTVTASERRIPDLDE
jgi:hypothetical protein